MNINVNTLLLADDHIVIQSKEDDLQRSIYLLDKVSPSYNMKKSISKTKSMSFNGKEPIRTKLVIDN